MGLFISNRRPYKVLTHLRRKFTYSTCFLLPQTTYICAGWNIITLRESENKLRCFRSPDTLNLCNEVIANQFSIPFFHRLLIQSMRPKPSGVLCETLRLIMGFWQEGLTLLSQTDVATYTKRPRCNRRLVCNSTCSIILDCTALIRHRRTKTYMRLISIKR